jgi:hypothetical protein
MFGTKTDSTGKDLAINGAMPLQVGERVTGHTISYFGKSKDMNGNVTSDAYEIQFTQSTGRIFTHKFFKPTEGWQIDDVKRTCVHICSKIVTSDEYFDIVANCATFESLMDTIQSQIMPKAAGMTFSLKLVYAQRKTTLKWYPSFPKFPNFIEVDGTSPSTLSTNPKYDFYSIPEESAAPVASTPAVDDLAF